MTAVANSRAVNSKALSEYIVPVLSGFLIVFGTAVPILTIACFLLHILYILLTDSKATFKLLFSILPFAQVYKVTALGGTSFFTYLEVLVCVIYLFKMNKIRKEFLLLVLLWAIYVLVGSQLDVLMWIKQIMIPLLIYIFFTNEKPSFRELVVSLTIGLLLSSTLALFSDLLPDLAEMMRMTRVWEAEGIVYRFSGLYPDPNYYTTVVILCVLSMLLLFSGRRMGVGALLLSVALIYFGAQTASKSFILMLAAVAIMVTVSMFLQRRIKAGVVMLVAVTLAGIVVFTGRLTVFENLLLRLFSGKDMTTGRLQTWGQYMMHLNENKIRWFVGVGIGAGYLNGLAAHNTYIDFVYYYGLVGTLGFFTTCVWAIGRWERRAKLLNVMPLICLMVMNMFLSAVDFFDFAFNLIFVFYAMQTDFTCLPKSERLTVTKTHNIMLKAN